MSVGERHAISLVSPGGTGYRWSAAVDDPTIVAAERVPGERTQPPLPAGANRTEDFALSALNPGTTTVRFVQARSFEPEIPPRETREIEVVVHAAS